MVPHEETNAISWCTRHSIENISTGDNKEKLNVNGSAKALFIDYPQFCFFNIINHQEEEDIFR